jgi:hypothetical protein
MLTWGNPHGTVEVKWLDKRLGIECRKLMKTSLRGVSGVALLFELTSMQQFDLVAHRTFIGTIAFSPSEVTPCAVSSPRQPPRL